MLTNQANKSFVELAENLLGFLPVRSQDILKKRFGFSKNKYLTLEEIGREYKITRERARQIIADAIKKLSKKENEESFQIAHDRISLAIEESGGIIEEREGLKKLSGGNAQEENAIRLFLACSKEISIHGGDERFRKAWLREKTVLDNLEELRKITLEILDNKKKTLNKSELVSSVYGKNSNLDSQKVSSHLRVLAEIEENSFGKWGLVSWLEVSPKNTRDKIYLVLKETGKPLHFLEIAGLIDKHGLAKKKAHPQTIHNELIKDKRFVLIGRGIYALSRWGYAKGTVREVLENILREKGPLSREAVLAEVKKARQVKKATVMINLNNSKYFAREKELYRVK